MQTRARPADRKRIKAYAKNSSSPVLSDRLGSHTVSFSSASCRSKKFWSSRGSGLHSAVGYSHRASPGRLPSTWNCSSAFLSGRARRLPAPGKHRLVSLAAATNVKKSFRSLQKALRRTWRRHDCETSSNLSNRSARARNGQGADFYKRNAQQIFSAGRRRHLGICAEKRRARSPFSRRRVDLSIPLLRKYLRTLPRRAGPASTPPTRQHSGAMSILPGTNSFRRSPPPRARPPIARPLTSCSLYKEIAPTWALSKIDLLALA